MSLAFNPGNSRRLGTINIHRFSGEVSEMPGISVKNKPSDFNKRMAVQRIAHLERNLRRLAFLRPDFYQVYNGLHGFFHVLHSYPFALAVKIVPAGKNIRRG